jgi:Type IV secretion system pilin
MRRQLYSFFAAVALALGLAAPLPASALNPFAGIDCSSNGGDGSAVCGTRGETADPVTGPDGILVKVTNLVSLVAGVAAVIFLILSGLKYVSSQGDAGEVSKAKQSIIYALVGIAVIALARQIINFVVGRI